VNPGLKGGISTPADEDLSAGDPGPGAPRVRGGMGQVFRLKSWLPPFTY